MSDLQHPSTLPKNYPTPPANYPAALFRLHIEAARRYLFESEVKEIATHANLPPDLFNSSDADVPLTVINLALFMQGLKSIVGEEKGLNFGREAFVRNAPLLPKLPSVKAPMLRAMSSGDKLFLRIRDALAGINRVSNCNLIVKWHGGAAADIFEDTGQHCYGYVCSEVACQTMTGYLEDAILGLAGVKVQLTEMECMVQGALACRWHVQPE